MFRHRGCDVRALLVRNFGKIESRALASGAAVPALRSAPATRRCLCGGRAGEFTLLRPPAGAARCAGATYSALPRAASAAALIPKLGANRIRIESEQPGNGDYLIHASHGVVWNRQNIVAPIDLNRYLSIHARHEQSRLVVDAHQHGEHRHRLLNRRLRLDLLHDSHERTIRERVDGDRRSQTGPDLPDVGFVDQRTNANFAQIRHLDDRRAAVRRIRSRHNHLAESNWLVDDGTGDRSAYCRLLQSLSLDVEGSPIPEHRRLRVCVADLRSLAFRRRDDPLLVELIRAILRLPGDCQIHVCRVQIGLCLCVGVTRVASVELNNEISRLHCRAGLHRHCDYLTGGFRLHLDDIYRFYDACRLRLNQDGLSRDRLERDRQRVVFLFRAGEYEQTGQREKCFAFQE